MGEYHHFRRDHRGKYSDRVLVNRDQLLGQLETTHADLMNGLEQCLRILEFQLYVALQLIYRTLQECQYVDQHCGNRLRRIRHQLTQMDKTG